MLQAYFSNSSGDSDFKQGATAAVVGKNAPPIKANGGRGAVVEGWVSGGAWGGHREKKND